MRTLIWKIWNQTADNKDLEVTIPILAAASENAFFSLADSIIRGANTVEVPKAKGVSHHCIS